MQLKWKRKAKFIEWMYSRFNVLMFVLFIHFVSVFTALGSMLYFVLLLMNLPSFVFFQNQLSDSAAGYRNVTSML